MNRRNESFDADPDNVCPNVPLYSRRCDNRLITRPYRNVLYLSPGISSGRGCRATGCFGMLKAVVIEVLLKCVGLCVFCGCEGMSLLVARMWPSAYFIFEII